MEQWPNFFNAGVTKAGTTNLYAILKSIPGIYLPAVKEPSYFNRESIPDDHIKKPIRTKKNYLNLYQNSK